MARPYEVTIAFRYLRSRKKAGISLTSFLTIVAFMLGVAALTVVTSVWNGFEQAFLDRLLGISAHSVVHRRFDVFRNHKDVSDFLESQPGVERATPFVQSEVIGQSATAVQGLIIKGVDPQRAVTTPLVRYVNSPDDILQLATSSAAAIVEDGPKYPGILIGTELAEVLRVKPGQAISIISPYGGEEGAAREASFRVSGVFHSGMLEFDSRFVFIDIAEAQRFLRLYESVTGLEVWTTEPMTSRATVEAAARAVDPEDALAYEVKDWSVTNRGIFGAVRQQKLLISIVLFFIVVVASFMTMATLILLILEKEREVAVLKALGATNRSVLGIFVLDGQIIGAVGCFAGVALGLAVCLLLERYGLKLDPRVYYLEQLPIVVRPIEIVSVCFGAMVLATLATLIPAYKAATVSPVDGLTGRRTKAPPKDKWYRRRKDADTPSGS